MMSNLINAEPKTLEQRNKELMIKFKNDLITDSELNELHENLEKLIFKIIHENYVSEDFGDVVSKIWEKIIRYKHCYNENNGAYVTTWIATVARNVINTLRKKSINYKSKNCLCDGFSVYDKKGKELSFNVSNVEDEASQKVFSFDFKDFIDIFEGEEKRILLWMIEEDSTLLVLENEKRKYARKKATFSFIKKKMNLNNKEFKFHLENIKKICYQKKKNNEKITSYIDGGAKK